MKIKQLGGVKFAAILSSGLIAAAGIAGAQTFYYQNAGSNANASAGGGTYGGTLADIGFDVAQWDRAGAYSGDTGLIGTRPDPSGPGLPYDINISASNLNGPPGTTLESVTLYLYATTVNIDGAPVVFSIYDGTGATLGSFVQTLSLVGPGDENRFFSFTLTGAQFAGGFSITSDGLPGGNSLTVASEMNTTNAGAFTPGLSATFAVPEPSAALLGALGSLVLFRRRRA